LPRRYSLGKRATQQAETRQRIIDAALSLYEEQGVSSTTMLDVARRADVAPGTVANHFGSAEALATEAMTWLLADLQMPGVELFDGVDRPADRMRLLVHELSGFFRRSQAWYRVREREPGVQAWADAEARYASELDALVRAALGSQAADAEAVAVVSAVLGTWVLGMLESMIGSGEAAADLVADLLTAWLATRTTPAAPAKRRR
jgi:AcrR family transcriptional regulator